MRIPKNSQIRRICISSALFLFYAPWFFKCEKIVLIVTTGEKRYKGHRQRKVQTEGFFSRNASAKPRTIQWDWVPESREGETELCTRHFGQQEAAAFWNGTKHCPLRSRFLVPEKARAGWKTRIQKACCPSFRYTERAQEFCRPFEQRQCRSAGTSGHELVQTPVGPSAHTHIPDTGMYLYRFRPHRRFFPAGYPWSPPDTMLLFAGPAPDNGSSFFPCDLMPPQGIPNPAFAASECLGHFWLVCVRMLRNVRFQPCRIDFPETSVQLFLFQIPRFFQLLFPFLYRWFGYLEDLMCFFQAVSGLPIFYCPFSISFWIAHVLILLDM